MAELAAIRDGLGNNLATISGLRVAEEVIDNPQPPVAMIALSSIDYHTDMRFGAKYNFTVQVIVGRASERHAQRTLDLYVNPVGASSVKAGVESNRTLGGVVSDVVCESMPNVGAITLNDQTYLAADFLVAVYV
jgi:hypothetical protein